MSTAPDPLRTHRPTWAEVDLDAFSANVRSVAEALPHGAKLIAVLKADAYGHGAPPLALRLQHDSIASGIAVALLSEGLELRRAGIRLPILALGPLTEDQIPRAIENDVTMGIVGPEELRAVCATAVQPVGIHLKLDSGMGRMGFVPSELPIVIELLRSAPQVRVDALYTHFANASDTDDDYTERQIRTFDEMTATLRAAGIDPAMHHAANSAAAVRGIVPGDFARVGVALFGAEPLDRVHTPLQPVMRWRTEVIRLKTLPAGHPIGYGCTFVTQRESRIATLPVGYADGYLRLLSNNADVLVRGRRAPVVGRISMDLVTVDVTDIEGVEVGDEVVLIGAQGEERITAEELAGRIGTISYEIFCSVSARVPRVWIERGRVVGVRTRFGH